MFKIPSSEIKGIHCSDEGFFSYKKISRLIINLIYKDKKKQLVFLMTNNSAWSIINYISLMKSKHILMMLDENISDEVFQKYIKLFNPSYVVSFKKFKILEKLNYKNINKKRYFIFKSVNKIKNYYTNSKCKVMIPTSGSSGEPKTVMLSESGIKHNSLSIIKKLEIKKNHVPVIYMPINYSYGMSVLNTHLIKNCNICVTGYSFLQKSFWEFLKINNCTSFSGVPYTYDVIINLKLYRSFGKDLLIFTQAGGKLNLKNKNFIFNFLKKKRGVFYVMYGQTEAGPRISILENSHFLKKKFTAGKAIPKTKIYVLDKNKKKIFNKKGVVFIESKSNMIGYANKYTDIPKKGKIISLLNTRDIGKITRDGFLSIYHRNDQEVKIHGVRINLLDIKKSVGFNDLIITSKDNKIYIFYTQKIDFLNIFKKVSKKYNLNISVFKFIKIKNIRMLKNNKVDMSYFNMSINENNT